MFMMTLTWNSGNKSAHLYCSKETLQYVSNQTDVDRIWTIQLVRIPYMDTYMDRKGTSSHVFYTRADTD